MSQAKVSKKLVSVSTTFMPVIQAREQALENAETSETIENSENSKNGDEDLGTNLA